MFVKKSYINVLTRTFLEALTNMYGFTITKREFAVTRDFDWRNMFETVMNKGLQSNCRGIMGMEQIVQLVAGRTNRRNCKKKVELINTHSLFSRINSHGEC